MNASTGNTSRSIRNPFALDKHGNIENISSRKHLPFFSDMNSNQTRLTMRKSPHLAATTRAGTRSLSQNYSDNVPISLITTHGS